MAEKTAIEWCDSTFNPWIGCTKVSPACDHCYAEHLMDQRMHRAKWGAGQPRVRTSAANWRGPARWNVKRFMQCADCGWRGEAAAPLIGCGACGSIELNDTRRRVFCASLADVFDNDVPQQWRVDLLRLIADTPHLDWLLLTKRIGNAHRMIADAFRAGWPNHGSMWEKWHLLFRNIWLGATVVNQDEADRDIPKLLTTPAAKRFLSIEPMLGPVYVEDIPDPAGGVCLKPLVGLRWIRGGDGRHEARSIGSLDWIICGGESGPHARPMHPDWVRNLRTQCATPGVPFHFKQWGAWSPRPGGRVMDSHRWPIEPGEPSGGVWSYRGTGASRLLDGVEHNGFP